MNSDRFKVPPGNDRAPLLDFLAGRLELSRNRAKALLDRRDVFVNGRRVWMARHVLRAGDEVEVLSAPAAPAGRTPPVLFRDECMVVVHKPAGLLSDGAESLEAALREDLNAPSLLAVHRLDRDTTGCLIYAMNRESRDLLQPLFESREITKLYHALVLGKVPADIEAVTKPVDGMKAITRLKVLDSNREASHLLIKLETGRTHQIRKHMEFLRHPVLGDRAYGTGGALPEGFRRIPRQMLHASGLRFEHPVTGERLRIDAPLPADFRRCLRMLRLT